MVLSRLDYLEQVPLDKFFLALLFWTLVIPSQKYQYLDILEVIYLQSSKKCLLSIIIKKKLLDAVLKPF
jgi:hypothetical protein